MTAYEAGVIAFGEGRDDNPPKLPQKKFSGNKKKEEEWKEEWLQGYRWAQNNLHKHKVKEERPNPSYNNNY